LDWLVAAWQEVSSFCYPW